jgi:hypothetical protein
VLGVTIDKIFSIIEKKTRPGIAAVLHKVWRTLTGAWDWVVTAMEKGPAGLWERLKEHATGMLDALIGSLVDWATKKVVTVASPRLLAALNPIGAIINAILAAWSAIQTAAQYLRDILAIVDTVLDTALELAAGAIGKAANFVEKALAAAIPIAIGFLANFLRLGDLPERIREMVEKLQEKVEEALGKLIDKALAAGRAILERLGVGPAKDEVAFAVNGEQHRLYTEGEDAAEQIWLESDKKTGAEWLTFFETDPQHLPALPRPSDAALTRKNIGTGRDWLKKRKHDKQHPLAAFADVFKELFKMFGHPDVPPTKLSFKERFVGGKATGWKAKAAPLTLKFDPGETPSSSTMADLPEWERARRLNQKVKDQWVKMHLIHFDLGGPDKAKNFTPGTKSANTGMFNAAEKLVINELISDKAAGKRQMWYEVAVQPHPGDDEGFAMDVAVAWGDWDTTRNQPGKKVQGLSFRSDPPDAASLSRDTVSLLKRIGGLPPEYASVVYAAQYSAGNFKDVDEIIDRVQTVRPKFAELAELRKAINSGIADRRLAV